MWVGDLEMSFPASETGPQVRPWRGMKPHMMHRKSKQTDIAGDWVLSILVFSAFPYGQMVNSVKDRKDICVLKSVNF